MIVDGKADLSLVGLIGAASRRPRSMVIEFPDGEEVSLADLWREAGAVGGALRRSHGAGGHVAGLLTAGHSAVVWLLGAWRAGLDVVSVPVPPRGADMSEFVASLSELLAVLGVDVVYADAAIAALLPGLGRGFPELDDGGRSAPDVSPGSLVQFTSGSTGFPTAVRLSQSALARNVQAVLDIVSPQPGYSAYSWLPLSHDMGLVGMLLSSLVASGEEWTDGATRLTLRLPEQYLKDPATWLRECSAKTVNVTAVPPLALEVRPHFQPDELDLRELRCCIVGGDTVRDSSLERFAVTYAESGLAPEALCPAYGMAEAALAVTISPPDERWTVAPHGDLEGTFVSSGRPLSDISVSTEATTGRISIKSPSLASGVITAAGERSLPLDHDGFLRTSDIGFTDAAGNLFVVGRTADQIVVRGKNIRPDGIENIADSCGFRRGNVAVVQLTTGEVVVVGEPAAACDPGKLRRQALRGLGLRIDAVYLTERGQLPKTSSGKIRREEVRQLVMRGEIR